MVSSNGPEASAREVSSRKRRANRRNAKKSTGPRSKAGKARSAMNATTHGIFCSRLLLPGEDDVNLFVIREGYLQKLAPQDIYELSLVDQIFIAQWRLMRAQRAETDHLMQLQFQNREMARNKVSNFIRKYDLCNDLTEAEKNDEDRDDPVWKARYAKMRAYQKADEIDMPAESLLCQAFMDRERAAGAIERMSRYEQRLQTTISRCMRDLERLRGSKPSEWSKLPPSPFLANPGDRSWPPDVIDDDELEDLAHKLRDVIKRMEDGMGDSPVSLEEDEDGAEEDDDDDGSSGSSTGTSPVQPSESPSRASTPIMQNEPTDPKTAATSEPVETSVGSAVRTIPPEVHQAEEARTPDPTELPSVVGEVPASRPKAPSGRQY